jgi:hypothetical protein
MIRVKDSNVNNKKYMDQIRLQFKKCFPAFKHFHGKFLRKKLCKNRLDSTLSKNEG